MSCFSCMHGHGYGVSAHVRIHRIRCQARTSSRSGYSVPMTTPERDRATDPRGRGRDHRHRGLRCALHAPGRGQGRTCRCPPSSGTSAPRTPSWPRWSARATRTTSATQLRTQMEPGDVAAAVRVVVGDYEEAGQQLMHMLAPGAPLPGAVGAARHRPARPPQVGAVGVRPPARRSHRRREGPSSRTCWSSPPTSTRGSSSASTAGSARERPRAAMTELCEAVVAR